MGSTPSTAHRLGLGERCNCCLKSDFYLCGMVCRVMVSEQKLYYYTAQRAALQGFARPYSTLILRHYFSVLPDRVILLLVSAYYPLKLEE